MSRLSMQVWLATAVATCCCSAVEMDSASHPAIVSVWNSKTGDDAELLQVRAGERVTLAVKAKSARRYRWLVGRKVAAEGTGNSFVWSVPDEQDVWKIRVIASGPVGEAVRDWFLATIPVYVEGRKLPPLSQRPSRVLPVAVAEGAVLKAGAARVDVTPSGTVHIDGFGGRTSTGIHDRLYVRALVLDNGCDRLAIISWDKQNPYDFQRIAAIRRAIEQGTGIPAGNILINATHTHSSCDSHFERASVEAVVRAWKGRRAARIGVGSKMIYGIGSNRRLPDGRGLWGSNQPNPEAVMDNECGLIRLEDLERNLIAIVVNYSAHPTVLDGKNTLISGDYAGIAMAEIERRLDGRTVALFLQGCAGDTGTQTFRRSRTIPEAERLGRRLADYVLDFIPHIDVVPWVPLAARQRMITLPQKKPTDVKRPTDPPIQPGKDVRIELQALLIDDTLIMALGSIEPYVAIGLNIKAASPFRHTFVLGYSNGPWLGYVPSTHGYAVNDPDAKMTPYKADAPRLLVEEATRLAKELKSHTTQRGGSEDQAGDDGAGPQAPVRRRLCQWLDRLPAPKTGGTNGAGPSTIVPTRRARPTNFSGRIRELLVKAARENGGSPAALRPDMKERHSSAMLTCRRLEFEFADSCNEPGGRRHE